MKNCEEVDDLLSGYLDGELTQSARQRVEIHLDTCADCQSKYDQMQRLQAAVGQISIGEIPREDWSHIMSDVTVRSSRGVGWILYVVGILILVAYGGYQLAVDDAVPALIKTAVGGLVLGILLLFVSVLLERIQSRKSDPYKDVKI